MKNKIFLNLFFINLISCTTMSEFPTMEKKTITAETPQEKFVMKVAGVDQFHSEIYVSFSLAIPTLLSREILEKAVAKTLDDLPEFASRLVVDKAKRGAPAHFVGASGLQFEYQYVDDPERKGPLKGLRIPGLPNSPEMRPKDWGALHSVRHHRKKPNADTPLVFLRLTHLKAQKVSLLGLCINHALGDVKTYSFFLQSLSYHAGVLAGKSSSQNEAANLPKFLKSWRSKSSRSRLLPKPREGLEETLSTGTLFWQFPRFILRMLTHEPMTFSLSSGGLAQLKEEISNNIEKTNPGEWVSTYEILMASVLEGVRYAEGPRRYPLTFIVVIDLRGRTKMIDSPFYVGNAVSGIPFHMHRSTPTKASLGVSRVEWLSEAALKFHRKIRGFLNNSCEKSKGLDFEKFERDQAEGKLQSSIGFFTNLVANTKDPLLLNNWTKHRWFEMDFGSGVKANTFGVPGDFPPAFIQLNPRYASHYPDKKKAGAYTLMVSLPRKQARSFKEFIRKQSLPFFLVE